MAEKILRTFSVDLSGALHEEARAIVQATLIEHCLDTECGTFRWQSDPSAGNHFILSFATVKRWLGLAVAVREHHIRLNLLGTENALTIVMEAACATREASHIALSVLEETIVAAGKALEDLLVCAVP